MILLLTAKVWKFCLLLIFKTFLPDFLDYMSGLKVHSFFNSFSFKIFYSSIHLGLVDGIKSLAISGLFFLSVNYPSY